MLNYTQNGYIFISTLFVALLFLISIYDFINVFLVKKDIGLSKRICVCVLLYLFVYMVLLFMDIFPLVISLFLIVFIGNYIQFQITCKYDIVITSIALFVFFGLKYLFSFILILLFNYDIGHMDTPPYLLSSFSILILSNLLDKYPFFKNKRIYTHSYILCLSFTPLISLLIINNLYLLATAYVNVNSFFAIFTIILLFFLNFIVFKIFDYIIIDSDAKKQKALFEQQLKIISEYIGEHEDRDKKLRTNLHDMKNRLVFIKGLLENKNIHKSIDQLNTLIDENASLTSKSYSGNIAIDSILNNKQTIGNRQGIPMNYKIEIPTVIPFRDIDICILLGNAIDNAIEACANSTFETYIHVFIKFEKGNLIIRISNPYHHTLHQSSNGMFLTSKMNSEEHGFGLKTIKKVVDKYNGIMCIHTDNHIFDLKIVLLSE